MEIFLIKENYAVYKNLVAITCLNNSLIDCLSVKFDILASCCVLECRHFTQVQYNGLVS